MGSEYTLFFKRADYDGKSSIWHVFGYVVENLELLKYIFWTAGENNGISNREVVINRCKII